MARGGSGVAGLTSKHRHTSLGYLHDGLAAAAAVTPPPVAGYYAWYDATQIPGLADGQTLTAWPDASGNMRPLSVVTGTPTFYKTTSAKLVNGRPAVWFNGDGGAASASAFTVPQPLTVFVEARCTDVSVTRMATGQGSGTCQVYEAGGGSGQWAIYAGNPVFGPGVDTNLHCLTGLFNGGSSSLRVDGAATAGNSGAAGLTTAFVVGNAATSGTASAWLGPICEVIVYPLALTAPQMASVEAYLAAKW
jgi:hypothetical protein